MKKIHLPIIISAILLWAFSLYQPPKNQQKHDATQHQLSGMMSVVDGDTLRFGKERIRLIKIDTPESKQECFDENSEKYLCGIMAKNFLIKLIGDEEVLCKYEKLDMYQRYLAECFVGDLSINEELVRSGMAVVFSYDRFDEKLKDLQDAAKKDKRGIWRGEFELPKDYRKRMRR